LGGVKFHIDKDVEDGQISIGNGIKTYTFTTHKEDVAGVYSTQPWPSTLAALRVLLEISSATTSTTT
jgi:hypothetical protein